VKDVRMMIPCFFLVSAGAIAWANNDDTSLSLGMASEHDGADPEWMLDFQSGGIVSHGKRNNTAAWLPFAVSWDFLEEDGSQKIADRVAFCFVTTNRQLEDGKVALDFTFPSAVADYDMAQLDATAMGGTVSMDVWEDYLRAGLGLDIRFRARLTYWSLSHYHAVVGVPLFVTAASPVDVPWFAYGEFRFRPNPVAWGEENFFVDASAQVRLGYTVVEGEEIKLRPEFRYDWLMDTLTYPYVETVPGEVVSSSPEKFAEWTLTMGLSLLF